MTQKNNAHPSADTTVSLFEKHYKRVEEELKKYEHQAGRSRLFRALFCIHWDVDVNDTPVPSTHRFVVVDASLIPAVD